MNRTSSKWGIVLAMGVAACGGDDASGFDELSTDRATDLCMSFCEADVRACLDPGQEPDPEALPYCVEQCLEFTSWMRGDAAVDVYECLEAVGCGEGAAECWEAIEPEDFHRDYEPLCADRIGECSAGDPEVGSYVDCMCDVDAERNWVAVASPETVAQLKACLQGPCEQFWDCFESLPEGIELVYACLFE